MNIMIPTALVAVLAAAPALALDYNCSPFTNACVPRASQPSIFDPALTIYYPPRIEPRTCPLDGPGAWSCDTRERVRRDRGR